MVFGTFFFPGITFEIYKDVKIVDVYEIIKLTESKVIYLGTFKCAATARVRLCHSLLLILE